MYVKLLILLFFKHVSPLIHGRTVNSSDPRVRHFTTAFFRVNGTTSTYLCQGHFVNLTFLITTARCGHKILEPNDDGGAVFISGYGFDLNKIGKPEEILKFNNPVKKVIFNPKFYDFDPINDVAFVVMHRSIVQCQITDTFHPILIMTSDHFKQMSRDYYLLGHDEFRRESKCFIRSWGKDEENEFNMKLREIPVHLLETTDHYILLESEITEDDGFVCWGDIGGAVYCEIEEVIYIYSLVSFSDDIVKRSEKDCKKLKTSKMPFLYSKNNRHFIDSLFYNHSSDLDFFYNECDTKYKSRLKKHKLSWLYSRGKN
uniref:Peptidase S1 domain-containing protein n=1 Tax=Parastrongyloides trichosuri TaxID=131310 RepID=A0A0N4ZFS3_PARTI